MIEKKTKNKTLLYVAITFVVLVFSLLFMAITPTMTAYASSTDVRDQYSAVKTESIYNNIVDKQYYDLTAKSDAVKYESADNVYTFGNGANIFNHSLNKLVFTLELTNANNENIDLLGMYKFTLYRIADDGVSAVSPLSILFVYFYNESENHTYMYGGIRRDIFSDETIGLSGHGRNIYDGNTSNYQQGVKDTFASMGYELIYYTGLSYQNAQLKTFTGEDNRQFIYITTDVMDRYTRYFVRFEYDYLQTTDDMFWNNETLSAINSCNPRNKIDSKIASVYDVVNDMYLRNDIDLLTSEGQKQANTLLELGEVKEIQISYLEQIGNTPFATKKYAYVEVPVKSGMVEPHEVANAMGVDNFNVMQTSCMYFKQDYYTKVYNAYYLQNVWLSSKDANGHSVNMFLDINVSYRDYYMRLVDDGIMSSGMYEWLWNSMLTTYNELLEYDDSELYGYFGYAVIPDVSSINSLWNDLFDGGKSFDGVIKHFEYKQANLSLNAYNKLLTEYGYNWLSKAWNDFMSFFKSDGASANHYFFYVDGLKDNSFIAENGADDITDNGGAMQNGVENAVEDFTSAVGKLFENDWVKYIAGIIGLFLVAWLVIFLFTKFFKMKTAKQEFQNTKKRKRR